MSNTTALYPSVRADSAGAGVVSQAGGMILTRTVRVSGIGAGLSEIERCREFIGCGKGWFQQINAPRGE
ncbi:hypothetical protein [Arthrobacter sp. H20]|uniref:hypothetical protein n=1 Tax=Arthrobacter sp. H20 TaxID=1267981 RepID=UPI0004790690|nr:hypothetical protein [Arthrobacter sp. H20]